MARTLNASARRQEPAHYHHDHPEGNAEVGGNLFPTGCAAELEVTEWREDICQRSSAGCANQLEYGAEVACHQCHAHGCYDENSGEDQVSIRVEWLIWKIISGHHRATDKSLQGQGG